MTEPTLTEKAKMLRARALDIRDGGALKAMNEAPALVEDVAGLLVDITARLDALTPYLDEGGQT